MAREHFYYIFIILVPTMVTFNDGNIALFELQQHLQKPHYFADKCLNSCQTKKKKDPG